MSFDRHTSVQYPTNVWHNRSFYIIFASNMPAYSKICCYLYPFRRYIQSVAVHGIKFIPESNSRMNSWDQALYIHPHECSTPTEARWHKQEYLSASTHALPLSAARQLTLPLAFGVVRAKPLLYLNNTAPARTRLQPLNCFWCARTLMLWQRHHSHNLNKEVSNFHYVARLWRKVKEPSGKSKENQGKS